MTCDYAACRDAATTTADGWAFCLRHLQEHQLLTAGLDLPDLPRRELPIDCGTEAGHQAHKRRGETPCLACRKAKRTADRLRNEDRYRQRWHRRTA